ncbi:integrase [Lysinibacillus agricola]
MKKQGPERVEIIKSIHPYSYATRMINNGAPIEVSLFGHEKNETTKIYAQLNGKLRQDFYSKYF